MKDLWPFERGLSTNYVDEKSEEMIVKIQDLFSQIKSTGEDEYRSIYFKCIDEYFDDEGHLEDTYETFEIMSSTIYKNREGNLDRALVFTVGRGGIVLANFNNTLDKVQRVDASKFLENIYLQLQEVLSDIDKYNEEIKENLPYENQEGKISHKKLNKITDVFKYDMPEGFIDLIDNNSPKGYDEMTLNIYGDLWGRAYKTTHPDVYKDMDPIDIFRTEERMYGQDDYEMDTQEGFNMWLNDRQHFHGCDVIYARVSLWVDKRDDKYIVRLVCCGEPWMQFFINIFNELKNDVEIEKRMYHDILTNDDIITISPSYTYYFTYSRSPKKEYITASLNVFPEECVNDIIKNIEWEDISNHLIEKV
jgi:hypothetical protein